MKLNLGFKYDSEKYDNKTFISEEGSKASFVKEVQVQPKIMPVTSLFS